MPAAGSNISMKFDPLPLPDDTPVKNEEERQGQKVQQASQLPRGSGFAPKSGQIAYIANNLLTGWMAGRHIQAEKKLNKAKEDVNQSRSIYDTLASQYSENISAGKSKDDPEMQKLRGNITAAWTNYVNTADKYTSPEDDGKGKKKSLGARIGGGAKKALMTNTDPELYRSASINILKQSGPPVFHQEATPEQKLSNATANDQLDTLKDKQRWGELAKISPDKLTAQQKDEMEGLERKLMPKTTEQSTRDDLLKQVMGGKALTKEQRQLAENFGFLKPNVTNTLTWKDKEGSDYLIAIGPDGNEVGRRKLGKGYIPPDQAAPAEKIFNQQIDMMVREYKRAYGNDPRIDAKKLDEDAHRFALMTVAGFKGLGKNPMDAERNQFVLDKALKGVIGEDKDKKAIYSNFIVSPQDDPNGLFFYRSNVVDPQSPEVKRWWWFDKPAEYYGGLGKDELPGAEREFRIRLRTELKKQNPKMSDEEINGLMPPPIFIDGGPAAKAGADDRRMTQTPDEKNQGRRMDNTPSAGGNHYRAVGPDGAVLADDLTEAEMEIMKKDPRFSAISYNSKSGPSQDDALNKDINRSGAALAF